MPQRPAPHDQTAPIHPGGLSDDTRPVPRDRGPLIPEDSSATPQAAVPASGPAEEPVPAPRTAEADAGSPTPAAESPAPAGAAEPAPDDTVVVPADRPEPQPDDTVVVTGGPAAAPAAAGETDADARETQDIRFAPGEAPGAAPAAAGAAAFPATATEQPAPTAPHTVEEPARGAPVPGSGGPGDGAPPGAGDAGAGRPWWRRPAVLTPVAAAAVLAGAYGVDLLVAGDEIPRNTVVAGVEIGGLSPAAAAQELEENLAPRVVADHVVVADDVEATLSPATAGITLDVDGTVDAADDQPLNPWTRLVSLFGERTVDPVITGEDTALAAQIETIAGQVDRAPVDATIVIEETTPRVVEPEEGRTLDREGAAEAITTALSSGGDPSTPIELPVDFTEVKVDAAEAERVLAETVTPALAAPVTVSSEDGAASIEVPVTAIAASLTFTPQEDGELAVAVDPAALQEAMGEELAEFGTPAEDARFEISGDTIRVIPSVDGTGVDPAALAGQLLEVLPQPEPRTVTAQLGPVPADFTTQEAEALGIREEISSFTTNFTNAASGTNIRVVAEEVDGAIVLPGETFSLNGHTGPRGTAQGYVEAGVINNGEFTTAVGGGVSQFATTMFNAVFFAGLEDVYHKPHSYYISRYPAGREATVYYDSIDLKWRNDSDTGVYVQTNWTPGSLTVTFWGTKRYEIESISSERYNIRQPVVQEKPDDGDCSPQSGSTGFDITVTRVFRDLESGAEIRREDFRTRYAAEPTIRCVPPAPAPDAPAAPEGAPPAPEPTPAG